MQTHGHSQDQEKAATGGDLKAQSFPSTHPEIHHRVSISHQYEVSREKKGLLVDFDGTVAQTFKAHYEPYRQVIITLLQNAEVLAADEEIPIEDWMKIYFEASGQPEIPTCTDMLQHVEDTYDCNLNVSPEDLLALRNEYVSKNAHTLEVEANEPLLACLKAYKEDGGALLLVTASCEDFVTPILEHLQIGSLFDAKLTADKLEIDEIKPNGAHYHHAVNMSGLKHDEVLAIEDTFTGIRSALSANVEVLLIPPPRFKDSVVQSMMARFDSVEGVEVLANTTAHCVILLNPEAISYITNTNVSDSKITETTETND